MVSVVVPVYKSEKTLRRCVVSLLEQDYEDIEILLVVDGPPDSSGLLAEELAREDSRIRVINQKNQGVSNARNRGIREARGAYIRFVDSDDYVGRHSIRPMVEAMEQSQSELVIAGYDHLYFGQTIEKLPKAEGSWETADCFAQMRQLYAGGFLNMPWNKLYVRECILNGFPSAVNLGEDLIFNLHYIAKTKRIAILRKAVCEYIQDDRGTTLSTKKRDDKIETALLLYRESRQFFEQLYRPQEQRLAFLDTKVITTFLDDVESLGFMDLTPGEKRRIIQSYEAALQSFLEQAVMVKPSLPLLDYKIIYFFLKRRRTSMTALMIALRSLVVRMVRKGKRA